MSFSQRDSMISTVPPGRDLSASLSRHFVPGYHRLFPGQKAIRPSKGFALSPYGSPGKNSRARELKNSTGGTPVLQRIWRLKSFDHFPDLILALAKLLREPAEQFIVLTFSKGQIVVGQTAVA